jgi:cyclic beta-1,2-glucan synthetase
MTTEDALRNEHQRQAAAQVSVANVITSLRFCSALDWSQHFEAVSQVERVLQRDPAGVYGNMDFLTRDLYRQAVEELSKPSGEGQKQVAQRAVDRPAGTESGRAQDRGPVGYYLVGKGRPDFEASIGYQPRFARRARRFVFAHATAVYLGSIGLLTALLLVLGLAYLHDQGSSLWLRAAAVLLLSLPASDAAIALVQRLAARWAPPMRLPRQFPPIRRRGLWWSSPRF